MEICAVNMWEKRVETVHNGYTTVSAAHASRPVRAAWRARLYNLTWTIV